MKKTTVPVDEDSDDPDRILEVALKFLVNNKFRESAEHARKILDSDKDPGRLFWAHIILGNAQLGYRYFDMGNPLTIENKDLTAVIYHAGMAENLLKKAKFNSTTMQQALIRLGMLFERMGNIEKGVKFLLKAARAGGSTCDSAYCYITVAHSMILLHRKKRALMYLKKAEKIIERGNTVECPDIGVMIGQIYYGLGFYDRAEILFESTIRHAPYFGGALEAHIYLARINIKRGNKKDAIAHLEKMLEKLNVLLGENKRGSRELETTLFGMMVFTFYNMPSFYENMSTGDKHKMKIAIIRSINSFRQGRYEDVFRDMEGIVQMIENKSRRN
ncbi:MAG: tetratricopeptide repeat protein [Candidatus Eremiobacteraeota bacterium]|nr:tetratricopeptide repeat protein [Candidatus Eremiobacteraeota bacterium]